MEDYEDDVRPGVPDYEPLTIPRLLLPGGGWVTFTDPEDLTGKDVKRLRKALDAPGNGTATNQLFETAMALLVDGWEIPGKPGLRIPRYDKSGKGESTNALTARQLRTIEKHMNPVLKKITGGDADDDADDDNTPT
jgi:hypothetical protein